MQNPERSGSEPSELVKVLMKIPDWQKRVIAEKVDLDTKIDLLKTFKGGCNFSKLDLAEQERLTSQLRCMREYSHILAERILNFK